MSRLPRLGFLGVGWIGRHRMEAIHASGLAEVAAVADTSREMVQKALEMAPKARAAEGLDELLEADLDGVVIATPSAAHADQAVRCFERGVSVFCQKPLGRSGPETARVVDAAKAANRLLGVDFSYRQTAAMQAIKPLVTKGELGRVYAIDLVFHNAYGPDKAWFYDPKLSGGGCVMDLGIHLVDLAMWTLGFPKLEHVDSALYAKGERLPDAREVVEDYAVAQLTLEGGTVVRLACSWKLQAGWDAVIEASFYGTNGGAALHNVNGSFYDFAAERFRGTARETLATPPDPWGGRAAVAWAKKLGESPRFDTDIAGVVQVAEAIDRIRGA